MSFLLLLPILSVDGDGEKNKGRGKHQMPQGEKWEKRVTKGRKEGKHKEGQRVIRNPDFPDLGILRRSLSKKRRGERKRGKGPSISDIRKIVGIVDPLTVPIMLIISSIVTF